MNGANPPARGNDEISPGVSWRLPRAAGSPLDPPAIAQFLGPGNRLISKVRVSSLDHARDAIDLVAATVDAPGLVEHAIFGEDLVDGRAPTRGVVFTEDVVKIAGPQGRYAAGHSLSPLETFVYRQHHESLGTTSATRRSICSASSKTGLSRISSAPACATSRRPRTQASGAP